MVTETREPQITEPAEPATPAETPEQPEPSAGGLQAPSIPAAGSDPSSAGGEPQAPTWESDLAAVRGKATAPPAAADALPGKTLDQVWEEQQQGAAGQWAQLMQLAEQGVMDNSLLDQLGLDRETGNAYWQKFRPYVLAARDLAEGHNLQITDALLKATLTEDERKEYEKRSYITRDDSGRVLPLSSRKQAVEAARKLVEVSRDKHWQARIDKGELLTKDDAEKIAELRIRRQLDELEKAGRLTGGRSGQNLSRGGAAGSQPSSLEAYETKLRTGNLNETEWAGYMRARQEAGLD